MRARLYLRPSAPIFRAGLPPPMTLRYSLLALLLAVAAPASAAAPDATPVVTLVHTDDTPQPFRLSVPSPNPFTASTRLSLTVDRTTAVVVAVHDALGRRVATLHDGDLRAGTYTLRVEAGDLPAGLYLVRATDGQGRTVTRAVSLVR